MPVPATEAWNVAARHFSADGHAAEKVTFLLGYAVLAPSGHNTQP